MPTQIGTIYNKEGFSCLGTQYGNVYNNFQVNMGLVNIPVMDVRGTGSGNEAFAVKFQNSGGSWVNGFIDLIWVTSYCQNINESGVRAYYAQNTLQGGMAVMKARYSLPKYDLNMNFIGYVEAGYDIAFKSGTCGATKPYLLYACYFKHPSNSVWVPINNNGNPSGDGWVDTLCRTKGYRTNWGLDGNFN